MTKRPVLISLLDPGWLFILAGLAMCAAVILVPAQGDLAKLQTQLAAIEAEDAVLSSRLRAYANFIDELDRGEPALLTRLAAAQLNLTPRDERPVVLASAPAMSVTDWIDSTVQPDSLPIPGPLESMLSDLTEGRFRLWLLGASMLSIFVGLMLGPSIVRRRSYARHEPIGADEEVDGDQIMREARGEFAHNAIEVDPAEATMARVAMRACEPADQKIESERECADAAIVSCAIAEPETEVEDADRELVDVTAATDHDEELENAVDDWDEVEDADEDEDSEDDDWDDDEEDDPDDDEEGGDEDGEEDDYDEDEEDDEEWDEEEDEDAAEDEQEVDDEDEVEVDEDSLEDEDEDEDFDEEEDEDDEEWDEDDEDDEEWEEDDVLDDDDAVDADDRRSGVSREMELKGGAVNDCDMAEEAGRAEETEEPASTFAESLFEPDEDDKDDPPAVTLTPQRQRKSGRKSHRART